MRKDIRDCKTCLHGEKVYVSTEDADLNDDRWVSHTSYWIYYQTVKEGTRCKLGKLEQWKDFDFVDTHPKRENTPYPECEYWEDEASMLRKEYEGMGDRQLGAIGDMFRDSYEKYSELGEDEYAEQFKIKGDIISSIMRERIKNRGGIE